MYLVISTLIFACFSFETHALTCRSNGGPKESELKDIYTKCLKMQDGKNGSSDSGDDWKDNHRNQRNDFEGRMENDRGRTKDKMGNRNERRGADDKMGNHDDRMGNRDDKMGNRDDRIRNFDDRSDSYDRMGSRDNRMGSDGRSGSGGRDNSMGDNRYGGEDNMNERNDFRHDYGKEFSNQYGYQSSQPPRRYKRERKEENSGKRSQFNPNPKRYKDSNRSDEKNSSSENNSSMEDDKKSCALHCFLENLEMTAEDGMPDRYLVTHALTKEVNNEDLKDFLQESVEECFQILGNENTEDKCAFSKNLMMCLSEKGRENCDDWKDDLKF